MSTMDLLIWTLVLLVVIGAMTFLLKVLRPSPRPKPAAVRTPTPAGYLRRWDGDRRWVADQERVAWLRSFGEAGKDADRAG